MAEFVDPGPLLGKVPDARKAPFPLAPAPVLIYVSLLSGILPACALLFAGAVGLGRTRLALASLGLAAVGFLAPLIPFVGVMLVVGAEEFEEHLPLVFFVVRLLSVGLGFLAYKLAHVHVRGHAHLDGKMLPLMGIVGPAFLVAFLLPGVMPYLLIPVLVLWSGAAG